MTLNDVLSWIYNSPLGSASREAQWLFATWESMHFIGLSLLIGAMLIVDLRLMGIIKLGGGRATLNFTHVAAFGFCMILISGIGCFSSNPVQYLESPLFRIKMVCVLIGGLNVLLFEFTERKRVVALADGEGTTVATKAIAGFSLALWFVIIGLGRFLPVAGGN